MPFPRFHWTNMRIPCFSFHVSVMKLEKPRQEAPRSSFPFSYRLFGGCLGGWLTKTFSYTRAYQLPFKPPQSRGMILDYTRRGHSWTLRSAFANLPSARFFSFQSLNPKVHGPFKQNLSSKTAASKFLICFWYTTTKTILLQMALTWLICRQ